MATPEETRLVLQIEANIKSLENALKRAGVLNKQTVESMEKDWQGAGNGAERAAQQIERSVSRSSRQAQQATRDLSFQMQDISQGLLSGTSPFTIMAQQSSQVTMALENLSGGPMQKLRTVFSGLGSMFGPQALAINAIILGLGYAAQAATSYFSSAEEKAAKATDKFKEHSDAIAGLKEAYGEAASGLREFAAIEPEVARFDTAQARDKLQEMAKTGREDILKMGVVIELDDEAAVQKMKELRAQRDKFFGDDIEAGRRWMDEQKAILSTTSGVLEAGLVKLTGSFAGLGENVQEMLRLLAKGEIGLIEFDKALAMEGLSVTNAETRQLIQNLRELVAEGVKAERALTANNTMFLNFDETLKAINATMPNVVAQFKMWASVGDLLVKKFGTDVPRAIGEMLEQAKRLQNISTTLPTVSFDRIGPPVTSGAGKFFPSQTELEAAEAQVEEAKREAERAQRELEQATKTNARKAAQAAKEASDRLAEALANQASTSVDVAAQLIGKSENTSAAEINAFLKRGGVNLDAATTAWCAAFVNSALAQVGVKGSGSQVATSFLGWGTGVKPGDIQRGDVLVEPRGRRAGQTGGHVGFATGQTRFIEGIQQIEMLSGNASDKVQTDWVNASEVVARRASEGFAVPAAALKNLTDKTKEATAAQKQLDEQYRQFAQIAQTAVSGFVNDLRNGVTAGEALRNSLDRVIDGLINMTIEAMFAKNALGGMFSSTGGGGFLSKLIGVAHTGGVVGQTAFPKRAVNPMVFAGAPRLHNGLMPGEFPAVLQRGEIVIPKNMAGKSARTGYVDNSSTSLGDVNIDMSQTGAVAANSEAAKQFGINVQKLVQAEMVRESRPGGLLRRVPT